MFITAAIALDAQKAVFEQSALEIVIELLAYKSREISTIGLQEMVRWQTPIIHMRRTATQDFVLGGRKIKENDKVIMWYLSGNRDEQVYQDADKMIVDRGNARSHVAFGFGIHRCMGNRLAEMQLRVLWEEIMQRFDNIELVGDVVRNPNNFIRGIAEVPVILHSK